jgi:CheY-like chemotaxis protein
VQDVPVILVVEDRDDDVVLLRRAFRSAGVLNPVVVATSGEEAITYMRGVGKYRNRAEFPLPRLILLDLKMPGLDGFGVLTYIRSRREFAPISVIVLTSSQDLKDVQRAYDLGANSFLVKETEFSDTVALSKMLKDYWLGANKTSQVQRESQSGKENASDIGGPTAV